MEKIWAAGRSLLGEYLKMGYEAYFVGGAVRDHLLHLPVEEIDIATNALPQVSLNHFPNVYPSGLSFGTVTVMWEGYPFEVTTFRKEMYGVRGRNPLSVIFADRLEEDLERRDFTINAMAMDQGGRVIDPWGGRKDLEDRKIRAVGDPSLRFKEDGLRLLRAIRFAANLSFHIDPETWEALRSERAQIREVSLERIVQEIGKVLHSSHPEVGVELISEAELLFTLTERKILSFFGGIEDELLRWAILFSAVKPANEIPFHYTSLPLRREIRDEVHFLLEKYQETKRRSIEEILHMGFREPFSRLRRLYLFQCVKNGEVPHEKLLEREFARLPLPDRRDLPIKGVDLIT
ncbi:MAG: hypothetical protein IMW85_04875, partial [Thermicanus sp.]|nr:hypothetical protein [Thermicanus sp.]